MQKKEDERGSQVMRFASCMLVGGIIGVIACVVILFLCSIGISYGWIGDEYMTQYTVIACLASAFLGGMYSVSRLKKKTLIVGIGVGIVQFLILLVVGVMIFPSVTIDSTGGILLCMSLLGGMFAGLLGGKRKKKRRK